ncbi:MAG: UvrD-helicase domain-containing protein, partial [Gammaproteobacteria bacterium]
MSAPSDARERSAALRRDRSFIVKAPAGSGKTGLLVRRYIALLATVDEPEEILAITFTRKATSEMRARVVGALQLGSGPEPQGEHERELWRLAGELLERDAVRNWRLIEQPSRLAIQTIDALATGLARRLPWLSGLGGALSVNDNTADAYAQAARRAIDGIASDDTRIAGAVITLLRHLDGDRSRAEALIATMLARREQWRDLLPASGDEDAWRAQLEQAVRLLIEMMIEDVAALIPAPRHHDIVRLAAYAAGQLRAAGSESPVLTWLDATAFPEPSVEHLPLWRSLADFLLTSSDHLRKQVDKRNGFPAQGPGAAERKREMKALLAGLGERSGLAQALAAARHLPDAAYTDAQWRVLEALTLLLKLAAAELRVQFGAEQRTDFCELTIGACEALGSDLAPSDLALALDRRIRHVLVDEFQDTSVSHAHLIGQLVAGFDGSDGRTLFVVGDPMQSIYRFREAEVGLFLNLWAKCGEDFPGFPVAPLALSANFRSRPALVEWVNRTFAQILPSKDDAFRGATAFANAQAAREPSSAAGVHVHALLNADDEVEASEVVRTVAAARAARPQASIAILGRSRRHLTAIVQRLREAGYAVRGNDLEPLSGAQSVRDLVALARAVAHPLDRIAALAVLRAPWCGLSLTDLHTLAGDASDASVAELLRDGQTLERLSEEGRARAGRVAEVLTAAAASQGRDTHVSRVRRAWLALGGPVCVSGIGREDIELVFDKLRLLDDGAAGARLDELEAQLEDLYVSPPAQAPDAIDVMTMHKAKGLEFDVVILPGLHKGTGADDTPLLAWTRL